MPDFVGLAHRDVTPERKHRPFISWAMKGIVVYRSFGGGDLEETGATTGSPKVSSGKKLESYIRLWMLRRTRMSVGKGGYHSN